MNGGAWIDLSSWDDAPQLPTATPPPIPASPAPPTEPAIPGRKHARVLSCPACGSCDIGPRDNGKRESLERWTCRACPHTWLLPRALRPVKGWVLP